MNRWNPIRVPASPWFKFSRDQRRGAQVRLFCFPHAGGGASLYRELAKSTDAHVEVVPALLPGREARINEPAIRSTTELVAKLADEIACYVSQPYALFGCSMGALIAFQLARRIRELGLPQPAHLFVVAREAPQLQDRDDCFAGLSDEGFLRELTALGGIAPEVFESQELLELLMPILRADAELCAGYRYQSAQPFDFPISAFGGSDDPRVAVDDLAAWEIQTVGAFESKVFSGGHFLLSERLVDIAAIVSERLR